MIEKEYIAMPDNLSDETKPKISPVSFNIGFISALLGLITPLLVYLAILVIIPTPPNGEDHTPGDGIGMMLLAILGIAWWTFVAAISFASTLIGFIRKETGRIKIFAIATSALSLVLIVSVYVGAYAFVEYEREQTKRYQSNQNL
jgi:hypothetical protein